MRFPLVEGCVLNRRHVSGKLRLLTVHELRHILGNTVDKSGSQSRDGRTRFFHDLVKPLPCRIDVLDPEKILYPFDCNMLSKATRQLERTHAIVAF